ncbi:polyphosphate glucokinase [Desulfuromusa kysingii]|uniref:Polyphosphate glucokinase n=1 Tax=Desulfuromusa kysingii TaxID=37625 RepID=A0A1H4CAT7_9BACT|nr:ROK family protein [Desulfuromusa kysingii]SEA57458.1 polyphosphate glucokinase [Desulfuromusa kysingii]
MNILGIDIGGSSIKGAIVDSETGRHSSEWLELETPQPAIPEAVAEAVARLAQKCHWTGVIGCGFPAVVQKGIAQTAANIDISWIGTNVQQLLQDNTGCPCAVVNDADAAGLAEMRFGAGRGSDGTVLILTLGTGIGSALFSHGVLFPNLELGALPLHGSTAENYASAAVRTRHQLSWQDWAMRLNEFMPIVERLLSPELILIGGGVSSNSQQFFPFLRTNARLLPAQLQNYAGAVGAACYAALNCTAEGDFY